MTVQASTHSSRQGCLRLAWYNMPGHRPPLCPRCRGVRMLRWIPGLNKASKCGYRLLNKRQFLTPRISAQTHATLRNTPSPPPSRTVAVPQLLAVREDNFSTTLCQALSAYISLCQPILPLLFFLVFDTNCTNEHEFYISDN